MPTTIDLFGWKFLVTDEGALKIETNRDDEWLMLHRSMVRQLAQQLLAAIGEADADKP